jgi:guanylate kinase
MDKALPLIVTITGPSCSGKSTLSRCLLEQGWTGVRSFTTRAPRAGERDGVDYDFRDRAWAERRMADGSLVEWVEYSGAYYGVEHVSVDRALEKGGRAFKILEPRGVMAFRRASVDRWSMLTVYLNPTPLMVGERMLRRLLAEREPDLPAYAQRLALLYASEMRWLKDHPGLFELVLPAYGNNNEAEVIGRIIAGCGDIAIAESAAGAMA